MNFSWIPCIYPIFLASHNKLRYVCKNHGTQNDIYLYPWYSLKVIDTFSVLDDNTWSSINHFPQNKKNEIIFWKFDLLVFFNDWPITIDIGSSSVVDKVTVSQPLNDGFDTFRSERLFITSGEVVLVELVQYEEFQWRYKRWK